MPIASTTRAEEFREQLARRAMVADGAMGTMLYSRGVFINRCFDELNLSAPDMVRQIHQEYVKAGAEILETNTFGANRMRLAAFGFAEKLRAINQAGVRLAREAAREHAFVAGAIGPLGAHIEPLGPTSFAEARAIFREQVEVLLEAGVDLLVLETFGNLDEMREALFAAREAAGPDMTIVAQVTIDDNGNLPGGTETEVFTRSLDEWPADVIGVNCSVGPKTTLETVERMMAVHLQADQRHAQRGRAGARGGPQPLSVLAGIHGAIRAAVALGRRADRRRMLRHHARAHQADPRRGALAAAGAEEAGRHGGRAARPRRRPCRRCRWRKSRNSAPSWPPGNSWRSSRFCRRAAWMRPRKSRAPSYAPPHGIDCINVPDGPRASARMSSQVTCQLIQREAGIEAVNHFCCRDRNILSIQSELLGAHCAGVRNLICITGDPPRMGSYPDATAVFDVDAIGLVNIANNLNHGLDIGGNPMGSQTALLIGVGANPGALNMDEEIRRFEWKVQAGAEYVVTQPVFDLALLEQFLKRIEHVKIPVICGIWPLTSFRNAEFMVNELRVPVPEHYMERMRQVDNAEKSRQEGVAIAREMVERVRGMVQGVQLSAPFGRYQMAIDVAEAIGPR